MTMSFISFNLFRLSCSVCVRLLCSLILIKQSTLLCSSVLVCVDLYLLIVFCVSNLMSFIVLITVSFSDSVGGVQFLVSIKRLLKQELSFNLIVLSGRVWEK